VGRRAARHRGRRRHRGARRQPDRHRRCRAGRARMLALRSCVEQSAADTSCTSLGLALALSAAIERGAQIINSQPWRAARPLVGRLIDAGARAPASPSSPRSTATAERGGFPAGLAGVVAAIDEPAASAPPARWSLRARRADDRAAVALGDRLGRVVLGGARERPARARARAARTRPRRRVDPGAPGARRAEPTVASTLARASPAPGCVRLRLRPDPGIGIGSAALDVRRALLLRRGRTFTFAALLLGALTPRPFMRSSARARGRLRLPLPRRHASATRDRPRARPSTTTRPTAATAAPRRPASKSPGRPLRADARLRGCAVAVGVGRHVESGLALLHFSGDGSYDFAEGYWALPRRQLERANPFRARLLRPRRLDRLRRARRRTPCSTSTSASSATSAESSASPATAAARAAAVPTCAWASAG
jgi:hypothetical protein